jgi:dTDP-glucose 4,6-dehydratase|tara:strand:+ start:220 stop:1161 length:942 start_codon:yes stop_codon:yes gene_type:complete
MDKKNILVTGGCGFIGGNFIRFLKDNFPENIITCLDKCGYASNFDYIKDYIDIMITKDISEDISSVFNMQYDYIFHFAAESHVDNSIADPTIFVKSNVLGTQNLLEGFRKSNYGKFIHISTDEVYGHLGFGDDSFTELTPIAPRSPYAASKASSDLLCLSYINTYNSNICITRCCNNYGPNQHSEKFIPTIIKSLSKGRKVPVYGEGMNIREWIHVHDHNLAVWAVGTMGKKGVYNIGSGLELSNIELVDKICKIMGKDLDKSVRFVKDRLGHDFRYSIDCEKIRKELAYEPLYNDFDDQLVELVEIYSKNEG